MANLRDASQAPLGHGSTQDFAQWGSLANLVAHSAENSPYLNQLLAREGDWILQRADGEVDDVVKEIFGAIEDENLDALGLSLRVAKARMALYLSLLDLGGVLPVMQVTRYLTQFADLSVNVALKFLLKKSHERKKLPENVLGEQCGIFALEMGKGGAYELNYSSDIDIILFYEPDRFDDEDGLVRKEFIRVAQAMVKLLSETTKDGYVFRVDLRLRPDPSVTPIVISSDQALSYYESVGRTWERAAFIKARVAAGDYEAGENFLKEMRPFIWRRHLDFAAIEDAHNMRLRIREHKGLEGPIRLAGHNLKLGRGGIREIEFFTQTRQLIFGGRNENLRSPKTLEALGELADAEIIAPDLAQFLQGEYLWLRRLEHFTQMIDDRQTHIVPEGEKLVQFLNLAGAKDRASFETEFVARLQKIDETMEYFFAGSKESAPDETATLGEAENDMIEAWMSLPALRTSRARAIFARLRPRILAKLSAAATPEDAFRNFDRFLRALPSGVQLFSLFEANPALLDLLAEICTMAPAEARILGENHRIFEAVLSADFFDPLGVGPEARAHLQAQLAREIQDAQDYEDRLNGVRRFVREAQFRVSVHLLRDLAPMETIGEAYSLIADLALQALYPAVLADMERRYGKAPGRGMVVLAMGKLGSKEMTRASDLDLVMIYDAQGEDYSDGARPLAASQFYSRFTQNFIQAITVATSEGTLYEVDMRLRPSGRGGPVAVSLASFSAYQKHEAWTWEHMALLRARVVAGEDGLGEDVMNAANEALAMPRDKLKAAADILEMRQRIRDNFGNTHALSLKHGEGRMMETELMVQGFGLLSGCDHVGNSMTQLLQNSSAVVTPDERTEIGAALALYTGLMQLARLSFAGEMPENLPKAWLERQSIVSGEVTKEGLAKKLEKTSKFMNDLFDRYYEVSDE